MQATRLFRLWFGLLVFTAIAVPLSLVFLDVPVAGFWMRIVRLSALTPYAPSSGQIGKTMLAGAAATCVYCVFAKRFPRWAEAAIVLGIAEAASYYLAEHYLKPFFARPDPARFLYQLRYGLGWHGRSNGIFPSAHAAVAAAGLSVAGLYFERIRKACIAGLGVIAVLLVIGRWHYLSDVVAGTMLGITVAMLVTGTMGWLKARPGHGEPLTRIR